MNISESFLMVLVLVLLVSGCTSNGGPQCPQCPGPGSYSECSDQAVQTRTNYRCSEATGYQCESYSEEKPCETGMAEGDDAEPAVDDDMTETSPGLDAAGDCSLLNPADIMNICGLDTKIEIQELREDLGQICSTKFISTGESFYDQFKGVSITYYDYDDPGTDDAKTLVNNLVENLGAEKLTDYSAYIPYAENFTVVYGTTYRINIMHAYAGTRSSYVCTPEQLKELGMLVSERIYG